MVKRNTFGYEVPEEEMNKMVYVGDEPIDEDTKRKYCRIFSRLRQINKPSIHTIPSWCSIDFEMFRKCIEDYCILCDKKNNTKREKCVKHEHLLAAFGLKYSSKLSMISEGGLDSAVRKAIEDIINKYLYKFLVPELMYTEEGLREVDIKDIPITFIKPYIDSFDKISEFRRWTIGDLENYIQNVQNEKMDDALKEEYKKAIDKYKVHRAEVIAKFSSLLVGNSENTNQSKKQLSELRILTGEIAMQRVTYPNKSIILSIPTEGIGEVNG